MSSLNAGQLDREITLQTVETTQDDETGEEVQDWDNHNETLFAQWIPGNTREAYFAGQRLAAHVDGLFRVPFITRPSPATNRILWDSRTYDIKGVTEIERGVGWELAVSARADS